MSNIDNHQTRVPLVSRRKPITSSSQWTKTSYLSSEDGPVMLTPAESVEPLAWSRQNKELLETLMRKHGALLLRGFSIEKIEDFREFVLNLSPNLLEYRERSSPRHKVRGDIYTSTDYPAHQSIFFHNENSYQFTWPLKIFFFCHVPARQGGETPIADVRKVYRRLSESTLKKFRDRRCMYVRNFDEALGISWQEVFQTSSRQAVEDYCRENGIACEWKSNNGLRTKAIRPAIAIHPKTGEQLWFNHVAFFHVTTLEAAVRDGLLAAMPESDLPSNSYYGDGMPIEDDVIDEIRQAYRNEAVSFPWQRSDILAVDNMLVAHSRNPFAGERKILVAMAEPYTRPQN